MNELFEILEILNPWWKNNTVSSELAKPFKRDKFNEIEKLRKYKQIIILSGLRRVGKTTILYQLINSILNENNSKKIMYFTFDRKIENLINLLGAYSEISGIDYKNEKITLFLDEITKLDDWASQLKIIYDSLPNIKIYISSSSSINLEEEAIVNLAGRYFLFNITPLSFKEYLSIKEKDAMLKNELLYNKEIKSEFIKYLLQTFPETITFNEDILTKEYLRTTIIDKIVRLDIVDRFENMNKNLLSTLITLFYKEPGIYLDYDNLSKDLKISKKTLFKHVNYLESTYLIKRIKNYRPNTFSQTRKLQRVYPYWWSLAFCYSDNKDKIMENYVLSILNITNYWRDGKYEIDFLKIDSKIITPIEVKNKDNLDRNDMKNMIHFLKEYKLKEGIIVYNGNEEKIIIDNKSIILKPFYKLAI